MKHPKDMGEKEIEEFLTDMAVKGKVSSSTQELLGHKDVSTTMIYTHVLNKGGRAVRSPLDHDRMKW